MAKLSVQCKEVIGTAIGIFLLSTSAFAVGEGTGQSGRIEIVERGIYAVESDASGLPSGASQHRNGPPALLESTTVVPAQLGKEFGFVFKALELEVGTVLDLTLVTEFPSEGLYDPETGQTAYRDERPFRSTTGSGGYQGYKLDSPHEVVAGTWTFKILYRGALLASQSFTLVAPPPIDR